MLYATLSCGREGGQGALWAINANTGAQTAYQLFSNVSSWDSYPVFLPDGTLIVGTSGTAATMYDQNTLDEIGLSTSIVGNDYGYVQVMGVAKPVNGNQQILAAGGDGWWWGSACTVTNGHELSNCVATKDTTVCLGADGVTAYNDQQNEEPEGVARFTLPMPARADSFHTNYVQWPWWIRTDLSGNVYVYDGNLLTKYNKTAGQLWQFEFANIMGLMITDDESTVIISNNTDIITLDSMTGMNQFQLGYSKTFADRTVQCQSVISPWEQAVPVPLSDSTNIVIVCQTLVSKQSSYFASVINLATKTASAKVAIAVPPAQVIVDNNGNLYAFGIVNKVPNVQKIPWSTLSSA